MSSRLIAGLLTSALTLGSLLSTQPSSAASGGCTVATVGQERPAWFCRFYATGPIQYSAVASSGWSIRRLIRQYADGRTEFVELAGSPGSSQTIPLDTEYGVLETSENHYIEVVVLLSSFQFGEQPPSFYRHGFVDVRPA